jgi:hypothetical protein
MEELVRTGKIGIISKLAREGNFEARSVLNIVEAEAPLFGETARDLTMAAWREIHSDPELRHRASATDALMKRVQKIRPDKQDAFLQKAYELRVLSRIYKFPPI